MVVLTFPRRPPVQVSEEEFKQELSGAAIYFRHYAPFIRFGLYILGIYILVIGILLQRSPEETNTKRTVSKPP